MADRLSAEARDLLTEAADSRRWDKGAFLLRDEATCRHIHGLWKGSVRLYQPEGSKETNLRFYFMNDYATDFVGLTTGVSTGCVLQAMESCSTLSIHVENLRGLFDKSPELEEWGKALLEAVETRELGYKDFFALDTPEARYSWLLRHDPSVLKNLSQVRLAAYIGISKDGLGKMRSKTPGSDKGHS